MTQRQLTDNYNDVLALARWLEDTCAYFASTERLLEYFEKPSKWQREFELWQMWFGTSKSDAELREAIVDALDDTRLNAGRLEYTHFSTEVKTVERLPGNVSIMDTKDRVDTYYLTHEYAIGPGKWAWAHDDYDGAPDSGDRRCGTAETAQECIEAIKELHVQMVAA